jgi:putative transposase
VKTIQAYRFALDVTASQERQLLHHAGAARFAHNWALARVRAILDQREAERTYGIPPRQRIRPGPSHRKAGPPIMHSRERNER